MYDWIDKSTSWPRDHFLTPLIRQNAISALTFGNVPVSTPLAASRIGDLGSRIGPFALDLNDVGYPCHTHLENPSWGACHWDRHGGGRMSETALEEFLVNNECGDGSGVNQPRVQQLNPFGIMSDHNPMASQGDRMQQQMMMGMKQELAECCSENRLDYGFGVGFEVKRQLNRFGQSSPGISVVSPCGSGVVTDRKRRCTDEVLDKTGERRKKRMIKNRESAARSRARKQDYMNQLEAEVKRLREANELLMKERLENQNLLMKVLRDNKEARVLVNRAGCSYDDRVKTEAELPAAYDELFTLLKLSYT